jgi:hypothetical protein
MKKSAAFAALILVAATGTAAAEIRFRGAFTVTFVSNCLARYVGETFNSAFRPARIGGNPNVTSITQLNQYSGDVYERAGGAFTLNQWVPVQAWGLDNLHYQFNARVRITSQTPAVINAATTHLNLTGFILNMGNDPGVDGKSCVAAFRGAYFRRME